MGAVVAEDRKQRKGGHKKGEEMTNATGVIAELVDFVERAERMGNYPTNTAGGIKAALRMVADVLTEQELGSLDTLRTNLDAIFTRIFNKKKGVSAVSLKEYRRRVNSVIVEYEQYGRDPQAMAGWKRKTRIFAAARKPARTEGNGSDLQDSAAEQLIPRVDAPGLSKYELPLRPNAKAILWLPADLTAAEAKRIKVLIDASVASVE